MKLRNLGGGNKKFIGTVISLAFTLLVVWIFVMATMNNSTTTSLNTADQMRLDSLRTALGRTGTAAQTTTSPNLFYHALPAFLFLVVILGALWLWNRRKEKPSEQLFTVVGEQQLAPNQTIKIISFQNEYWVIGVAGNNMTLLTRMNKDDWSPPATEGVGPPNNSFSTIFSGLQKMRS